MGRFLEKKDPIIEALTELRYVKSSGVIGYHGYENCYSIKEGYYYMWVTISLSDNKIYLYEEYSCRGEKSFEELVKEDIDIFLETIDKILEPYIG